MTERCLVGIEWAKGLEKEIVGHLDEIPFVELIAENFFDGRNRSFLETVAKRGTPIAVHAVDLSIGTFGRLKQNHLTKMLEVTDQVNAVNLSEHISMTEAGGISTLR